MAQSFTDNVACELTDRDHWNIDAPPGKGSIRPRRRRLPIPNNGFAVMRPEFTANVITSFRRWHRRLTVSRLPFIEAGLMASMAFNAVILWIGTLPKTGKMWSSSGRHESVVRSAVTLVFFDFQPMSRDVQKRVAAAERVIARRVVAAFLRVDVLGQQRCDLGPHRHPTRCTPQP